MKTETQRAGEAKIRAAFERAAREEKKPFRLSGRGHEPRVTLDRRLAVVLRGAKIPRVHISGFGAKYRYPRRVVERAARLLRKSMGRAVIQFYQDSAYVDAPA